MPNAINNLTGFANQSTQLQLDDGSVVAMTLLYNGTTERWTMDINYGTFTCNSIGVCCFPNMLRQWREILPFGIACVTADQTDPFNINDFVSNRAVLYLLNTQDVKDVESQIFGAAS